MSDHPCSTVRPIRHALLAAATAGLCLAPAPELSAQVFTTPLASTNPFAPFVPGAYKVYAGKSEGNTTTVVDEYLAETRSFPFGLQDVECHILLEIEFEDGVLVEISRNYFAEDDLGVVYYFGEVVDDYEGGLVVAHGGSWLVGGPTLPGDPPETATAKAPAVFMPADPQPGDSWKPEDLFPLVDETSTLTKVDLKVKVPAAKFVDVIQVGETSALPDSTPETKWYAAGVGVIKAKGVKEKLALVASTMVQATR